MASSGQFAAVVDDDESVARAISRVLRAAGLKVDTFTTGNALLQKMQMQPWYRPSCVILDVCMPDPDGLEMQRRLADTRIPIIFMTAHDVPEARDKALSAGAIGYLRKPFNTAYLVDLVRSVIA